MQKLSSIPALLILLLSAFLMPMGSMAADDDPTVQNIDGITIVVDAPAELLALQKRLDNIKQSVSTAKTEKQLISLNEDAQKLSADAVKLRTALQPQLTQIVAQLDVLGAAPVQGQDALSETAAVAKQRSTLNGKKNQLNNQIEQSTAIGLSAENLSPQIVGLRRSALKTQIALNTGSIFSQKFWEPLISPQNADVELFNEFGRQLNASWQLAWEPEWRSGSALYLLLAVALSLFGRRLLDKPLGWVTQRCLPVGRLRRSFLACATVLVTVFILEISVQLLCQMIIRLPDVSPWILESAEILTKLTLFSALVAGLGVALLSNRHPSWRLPTLSDPIANILGFFPIMLAIFIFVFGMVEQLNSLVGTSVASTLFGNGLSALLIALSAFIVPVRINHLRRKLLAQGEPPEARSIAVGLIQLAIGIMASAILVALLIGYIPLARFLTYELVWVGLVLTCLYLLIHLVTDFFDSLFSPVNSAGKFLKSSLNLDERNLALVTTLCAAISKMLLLLFAAVALLNGTFGTTTPLELLGRVVDMWGGKGLESLNIIPARGVNALLFLVIGWYVLRSSRRWLDIEFLPKTMMDRGMHTSLVTLFTNIGYVLITLLTLSMLGIEWNKLAWIVSALSVGIGFGLQEIVKNFISGLILLTERPVKVGDLVTISGVEGDIRRINVRATEIQLSDRSTVIVPNSQFISQNVRNATMGNAQGVVTITLTFPLDIDPEQVRTLLLNVYEQHEAILDTPPASVTFKELGPSGIVLSVTGYVSSPRMVSGTKSDLLYAVLKILREAHIDLSQTQTMILEQPIAKD